MKQIKVNKDGWSRWEMPIMQGYLMGCCDCGLVHEMEFEVVQRIGKPTANGWYKTKDIKDGRLRMRARRAS